MRRSCRLNNVRKEMTLYLLNLADMTTTICALSHGMVELNPVVNWMLSIHPALFPLVKIVFAYILCMRFAKYARRSRADRNLYATVVGIYAVTVVWNMANILCFYFGGNLMIHALHLLWIVPVSAAFGFATCAVLTAASRADREDGH